LPNVVIAFFLKDPVNHYHIFIRRGWIMSNKTYIKKNEMIKYEVYIMILWQCHISINIVTTFLLFC